MSHIYCIYHIYMYIYIYIIIIHIYIYVYVYFLSLNSWKGFSELSYYSDDSDAIVLSPCPKPALNPRPKIRSESWVSSFHSWEI